MSVDTQQLADTLWAAESEVREITMLTAAEPGLDLDAAYRVQQLNHERRLAAGEVEVGYKLGLVSRAKQLAMGVEAPLWGRLTNGLVRDEDVPLQDAKLIHPRVEPELAFLLGDAIDGKTATVASVLAATRGVCAALEVLDSRYENFRFTLPDVVADNASAAGFVLGGRLLAPEQVDTQLEGMVLRVDGEVVDTAAGAAVCGHPAQAVAWLAREVGMLPAGAIILTGGLTAPVAIRPGSSVSASFTNVGTVTVRCA